jgi:hypothetical protein
MDDQKYTRTTYRLTRRAWKWVKCQAAEQECDPSDILQSALDFYIKGQEEVAPKVQASGSTGVGEKRAVGHGR